MDMIPNSTFHIIKETTPSTAYSPGIYRVIVDGRHLNTVVTVLIAPEDNYKQYRRGGRKKKEGGHPKGRCKKPPPPLVGALIWMDFAELNRLSDAMLLRPILIERPVLPPLGKLSTIEFAARVKAMAGFLDLSNLTESITRHRGLSGLVQHAMDDAGVSRPFVYRQWSNLCRWGLDEQSLVPRRDRSGAPGIRRPCDPPSKNSLGRQKAGKKTIKQRVARTYGVILAPDQPGTSSEWAAAIRAADSQIPEPKPAWPKRCNLIVLSGFCGKASEVDGKIVLVKPDLGTYPNDPQIKRVLTVDKSRLELLRERTTQHHFVLNHRGLISRNWLGVAGPGHCWAIDSTVGEIFLRSSVNRAWIVGRPIVYIIVDIWSTAVVGFYVCLTGPSWSTAKVSLFNAAADPKLVAKLWGYEPILSLEPAPTMCYSLMCDRGEYLSQAHRKTALKLLPLTSYAPPYRGDLKGLVEVLHRIEKDAQFLFVPGALDSRRAEMELRKVNPADSVLTVREYTHYLYELFCDYNLTADRSNRLDAHMIADGVFPSPAGLWRWGHDVGIGYRKQILESDLISELLPRCEARVRRDAIRHAGCDYMSEEIKEAQWTAIARNCGGWDVPVNYYPGAMGSIWTPNVGGSGMLHLQISDQSRSSPEITTDEWADVLAIATMNRPGEQHQRKLNALDSLSRMKELFASAKRLTTEAVERASGATPTMTEARAIEVTVATQPERSDTDVMAGARDEALRTHDAAMTALLESGNAPGDADGKP